MGSVNLTKRGEVHKISLSKEVPNIITTNLNWNGVIKTKGFFGTKSTTADLDLACMFKLKNGAKGVIQALGNSFGSKTMSPFIMLDGDDRNGSVQAGETMYFTKPEQIEFAAIFAYIYSGNANWDKTGASITLTQTGKDDIVIDISKATSTQKFCVIATLESSDTEVSVSRVEEFFLGHREIDKKYNIGLNWKTGSK